MPAAVRTLGSRAACQPAPALNPKLWTPRVGRGGIRATGRRLAGGMPLRSLLRSTRSLSYVTRPSRPHEPLRYRRRPRALVVSGTMRGWVGAMNADRRVRLWSLVVERAGGRPVRVEHVCIVAMSAAGVDRAAVAVALSASPRETMYASDPVAAEVEELTLTLGEGPGVEALTGGPAPVAHPTPADRPGRRTAFDPAAVNSGGGGVVATPVSVGGMPHG